MREKQPNKWKASKKPGKQRAYKHKAALHTKGKFMHSTLSKELRQKHHTRSIRVRTGDKVKIMRGSHKKETGKIEAVDLKKGTVLIEKMEATRKEGSVVKIPFQPSNIMIIELNTDDKRRMPK